jgi:hypothetical protein
MLIARDNKDTKTVLKKLIMKRCLGSVSSEVKVSDEQAKSEGDI